MLIDASDFPDHKSVETDICIVGGGTAGITLARELIAQDFQVCLIDSGGQMPDQATQALYQGENIGLPYYPLDTARARYYGGSSNRWHVDLGDHRLGVRLRPFDAIDFEPREWVGHSGWPFDKTHLDNYYDRAQIICQITPKTFETEDWADPVQRPPLAGNDNPVQTIIYKFGWRGPFIHEYTKEINQADNITVLLHANVLEIETDESAQKVTSLRAATLAGNQFTVSARLYVIAAGGIETPRLLLLSNKVQTAGLGNQHDLVGRFFMEHLHLWSGIFVPSDPGLFQRTTLYNQIQKVHGIPIIGKLTLSEAVLRHEKLLNQNIQLIPRLHSRSILYPQMLASGVAGLATNGYRKIRRKIEKTINRKGTKVFILANMGEQTPNPNSRVCLSDDRDVLGQNRACLDWQVTEQDIHSIIRTQEIVGAWLKQTGLGQLIIQLKDARPPRGLHGGYHHMGTTRMHTNPKEGVVDANSRIHGVSNLYIAGPSVFPTGGYANPVLTIVALTVRLADHLKALMPASYSVGPQQADVPATKLAVND